MGRMKEAYMWIEEHNLENDPNALKKYYEYYMKMQEEKEFFEKNKKNKKDADNILSK